MAESIEPIDGDVARDKAYTRVARIVIGCGVFALVVLMAPNAILDELSTVGYIALIGGGAASLAGAGVAYFGNAMAGAFVMFFGVMLAQLLGLLEPIVGYDGPTMVWQRPVVAMGVLGIAAQLLPRRYFYPLVALGTVRFLAGTYVEYTYEGIPFQNAIDSAFIGTTLIVSVVLSTQFQRGQVEVSKQSQQQHVNRLEAAGAYTRRIAEGDLVFTVEGDGQMLEEVRTLRMMLTESFTEIRDAAQEVGQAAAELEATAAQQSSGATQQSAAVEETRATVGAMSTQAQVIEERAHSNSERMASSKQQSDELSEDLHSLISQTDSIEGLLDEIRAISEKSELLALNASLEGVRAGDAGRGFTLVARQMQLLAERVQNAVEGLQALNNQVANSSERATQAMSQTMRSSEAAADIAISIRELAERQQQGMTQIDRSVGEIADVATRAAMGSEELQASAAYLVGLVANIERTLDRFNLDNTEL